MQKLIFFVFLLFQAQGAFAQYNTNENMTWVFGSHAGISFLSGSPVTFTSAITDEEGTASVSDAAGNLLFYTNGMLIWNRSHNVMPSISAPGGVDPTINTFSTSQGSLIVPMPAHYGKYYVFSLGRDIAGAPLEDRLVYTIVDMTLDGGMGDVVAGSMGVPLAFPLSEKMVAVAGDSCNVWLIAHKHDIPEFIVFNITPSGISAPVTYTCGAFSHYTAYSAGMLKASHNRQMLAVQLQGTGGPGGCELVDFDPLTGAVSNCKVLDSASFNFGAEFSPDNTKLYCHRGSASAPIGIYQYDLSTPTAAAIVTSRVAIAYPTIGFRRDLKLAPNGKIYVNSTDYFLDCIPSPNIAGTGCGYNVMNLFLSGLSSSGLPNTVVTLAITDTAIAEEVRRCVHVGDSVALYAPGGSGMQYTWHNASAAPVFYTHAPGLYWVTCTNGCNTVTDTFHVILDTIPDIELGNDTTLTPGSMLVLYATHVPGSSLVWSTGSTSDTIHVATTGTYWATLSSEYCTETDTIHITVTAGINNIRQASGLNIFPNPADKYFILQTPGLRQGTARILCYNMLGQKVLEQAAQLTDATTGIQMACGQLPAGIYSVVITDEEGNCQVGRMTITR